MENKYEIIVNLDTDTKKIYERYFKLEGYQFLVNEYTILFVKKHNSKEENIEHENDIVQLVLNMAKKYFHVGILYIDLTNEINAILQKSKEIENFNITENYITVTIKRAFEKVILNKNASITPKLCVEEN